VLESITFASLAILFTTWFILSILKQLHIDALRNHFGKYDRFSVVPSWTFFAPNPGRTDLHLLYRDGQADGSIGTWNEILHRRRRRFRAIWNPGKREDKVLRDCSQVLRRTATALPDQRLLMLTVPYLIFLNVVCSAPASSKAVVRQFALVEETRTGNQAPEPIFVSSFHEIHGHDEPQ
jgi:hypothetical protein